MKQRNNSIMAAFAMQHLLCQGAKWPAWSMPPASHDDREAAEANLLCVLCYSPCGGDHALAAGGVVIGCCRVCWCGQLAAGHLVRELLEQLKATCGSEARSKERSAALQVIIRSIAHWR